MTAIIFWPAKLDNTNYLRPGRPEWDWAGPHQLLKSWLKKSLGLKQPGRGKVEDWSLPVSIGLSGVPFIWEIHYNPHRFGSYFLKQLMPFTLHRYKKGFLTG